MIFLYKNHSVAAILWFFMADGWGKNIGYFGVIKILSMFWIDHLMERDFNKGFDYLMIEFDDWA